MDTDRTGSGEVQTVLNTVDGDQRQQKGEL